MAMVWAALQFVLPVGLAYADARLELVSSQEPRAHVESKSTSACAAVHSADCALCQQLNRLASPAARAACPGAEAAEHPTHPTRFALPAFASVAGEHPARGPPKA